LKKDGVSEEEIEAKWFEGIKAPPDELIKFSDAKAQELLYRERLSPAAQKVQNFLQEHKAMQLIVPFFKTPVNITKWAWRRLPGIGLMGRNWQDVQAGGRRAREVYARQTMGAAFTLAATAAYMSGALIGGEPDDPTERDEFYRQGKLPWSLRVKFPDGKTRYISFARWEPINSLIKMTVGPVQAVRMYKKEIAELKEPQSVMWRAVGNVTEALLDQTYLMGLNQASQFMNDPVRYGWSFVRGTVLGATVPSGVAYTARLFDPQIRKQSNFKEAFFARIPGLSKLVSPRLGALGEERKLPGGDDPWGWFYRAQPLVVTSDEVSNPRAWEGSGLSEDEIKTIETELSRIDAHVSYPKQTVKLETGAGKKSYRYTSDEFNELLKLGKPYIIKPLRAFILADGDLDAMPEGWSREEYKKLPDANKKQVIERIMRGARWQATIQMKSKYPHLKPVQTPASEWEEE